MSNKAIFVGVRDEKHTKQGRKKMKNKLQKLFSVGLLSASAVYISMALMATGCSSDNSSVTEGDTEEYTEVAESNDNEDVESSDIEETSKTEENSKAEKSSNDKDSKDDESVVPEKQEPAESEEESADAQETATTPEVEDPAEPNDSAEPEESAEPKEPNNETEPGENVEPEGNTEPNGNVEPDVEKKVARHTREWYRLRDTVSYFIAEESRRDANALQKLEDKGYSFITRCEWDSEVEDCSMDDSEFHAAYNSNEDVMHKLTDAGILWDGSEWEGWNPIEDGESSVVLDTVLSVWSNDRIYVSAVYRVRYYLDSDPDAEHSFLLDVPVKYMRVD